MANYQKELKAVKAALAEAALLCRRVQRTLAPTALTKQDRSPVTLADFGSQALVCRTLREAFPGDPIMAEEDAGALRNGRHAELLSELVAQVQRVRPDARPEDVLDWIDYGQATGYHERFWTLDPVDGTKGFLRGQHYAIALALIERGQVVLSGLSCPNMDKGAGAQFVAARGQGGRQVAADTVRVSSTSATASARLCESVEAVHSAHGDAARVVRALGITRPGVRLDSQAKYAAVARGDADIYLRLPRDRTYIERIWDHAAGSLLVTEAGGRVTDCRGRELDFGCGGRLERNLGIVATNGVLHDAVIASLKQLGIGQG